MPALCINTNYSIRFLIFGIKNQRRRFHSLKFSIVLITQIIWCQVWKLPWSISNCRTNWWSQLFTYLMKKQNDSSMNFFPAVKSYTAVLSFHISAGVNCCMSSFLLPFNESPLWCMESQQGSNYKDIVCKRSLV